MTGFRTQQPLAEYALELIMCALLCTLLHSAACVLSDIFDHDLDRKGIRLSALFWPRPLTYSIFDHQLV